MLQAHHIRSRGNMSTKFDPDNGILLCRDCHCWVTFAEDEERRIFHIKQIGEKEYQELCDRAKRIKDWNVGELEDLIKDLQEKIKRLNNTASI